MIIRTIAKGVQYTPGPKPTPEQMNKRAQIWSVIIIVVAALWIAYAACH
jgi:hypothetical protein